MPVPRPLPAPVELSLRLDQAQRELWSHGTAQVIPREGGVQVVQRSLEGSLDLRWQAAARTALSVSAPLSYDELAVWTGGIGYPRVDDPGVHRSQGLGDLQLGLRQDFGALGWGLLLTAPTGLGPWEAPHPLAGTGEGRWAGDLRLSLRLDHAAWSFCANVQGGLQAGREAVLSAGAPIGYDDAGPIYLPASATGPAYLDPRWGSAGALGVGWTWFDDGIDRHSLALSVCGRQRTALSVGGAAVPDTDSALLWLQPELQARFKGLHALAGWQSPPLYSLNTPVPYWGELHFRLDHAF
jgi:hypothetical protein